MKNTIAFILVLLIIIILGVGWGIYEYQTKRGLTTPETTGIIKNFLNPYYQHYKSLVFGNKVTVKTKENKTTSNNVPLKTPEKVITATTTSNNVLLNANEKEITSFVMTPITPTGTEINKPSHITKQLVKPEAQQLVDNGNLLYDEGIKHLQNTFKKDDTFDKENNLAIEKFRGAMKKYLEAEKIDTESQWLMNRIRDTNKNLVTCRKQARHK